MSPKNIKPSHIRILQLDWAQEFGQELFFSQIQSVSQHLPDRIYLVGGCVRDFLLGKIPLDIDCSVRGDAPTFATKLQEQFGGDLRCDPQFGAAHWTRNDQQHFDFTTTRTEVYHRNGELPITKPSDLYHDLFRRDFTINAIAISISAESWGAVIDPFQGQHDLQNKILRVIHPKSFLDDPTRIFRASRYSGRYHLQLNHETQQALQLALSQITLGKDISFQRIGNEILLICEENKPSLCFSLLEQWGVLDQWFPHWKSIIPLLQRIEAQQLPQEERLSVYWGLFSYFLPAKERFAQQQLISQHKRYFKIWKKIALDIERLTTLSLSQNKGMWGTVLDKTDSVSHFIFGLLYPDKQPIIDWWKQVGQLLTASITAKELIEMGIPRGPLIGKSLALAQHLAWSGADCHSQQQAVLSFIQNNKPQTQS